MTDNFPDIKSLFASRRVAIVGDLVADQFLNGTIARVSREAPVFILRHDATETRPGGAANAAANVAALGGTPVLIGIAGTDSNGDILCDALSRAGVDRSALVRDAAFKTTTKVRVLAGRDHAPRQQVIRIDYENTSEVSAAARASLLENLRSAEADAIILSDYNYGVANAEIADLARSISRERSIPLVVDSRFRLREFAGASSATPNQEEVELILGKGFTTEDCSRLRSDLGLEALLVTCGSDGMLLFAGDEQPEQFAAAGSRQPVDVTGAGDAVIAAYALGLASGLSFRDAAAIANHAGGIVVMKKGTAVANVDEILSSIANNGGGPHALPGSAAAL